MKVRMPQPRRKSRNAPNETRAQKGSWHHGLAQTAATELGDTNHRHNLLLDLRRQRDQLEVEREVELKSVSERRLGGQGRKRTEETRRPMEMVCWARVIFGRFRR